MSRQYAALYTAPSMSADGKEKVSVIAKDLNDGYWFVWEPSVSDRAQAEAIADAMNAGER